MISNLRPDWYDHAACTGLTDLFFDFREESIQAAKDICSACPVRRPCAERAAERRERFGVWAGKLMPYERDELTT